MASIRATSSNSANTGTAVSVSAPTGTVAGDVVIVYVHGNGQTTISDNNGGTTFTEDLADYKPNTSYGHTVSVFSRRIQSGDPSTYNFTLADSGRWSIIAVTIQEPNALTIYDVNPTTANAESNGTTFDAPSINTLTDGAIHLAMAALDDPTMTVTGFPSGYTNTTSDNDQPMGVAGKVITSAGATGAQTFTFSDASSRIGVSLAIKPASTATATYIEFDTLTQGNWVGTYGTDGFKFGDDGANPTYDDLPAYITNFSETGTLRYTWEDPSGNAGALEYPDESAAIACTFYSASPVALSFSCSGTRTLAVYCFDYEESRGDAQVKIYDSNTDDLLATSDTESAFYAGVWFIFTISGNVRVEATATGANAVISGLFFGDAAESTFVPKVIMI